MLDCISRLFRESATRQAPRIARPDPAVEANPSPLATDFANAPRGRAISFQVSLSEHSDEDLAYAVPSVNSQTLVGDPEWPADSEAPTSLRARTCRTCLRGALALIGGGIGGTLVGLAAAIGQHESGANDESASQMALAAGIPVGLVASALLYRAQRAL